MSLSNTCDSATTAMRSFLAAQEKDRGCCGPQNQETVVRFSPEWWAAWAGVSAVGLTIAAALAGVVAWHFSTIAF
jgi:hypothetical protein